MPRFGQGNRQRGTALESSVKVLELVSTSSNSLALCCLVDAKTRVLLLDGTIPLLL